MRIEDVRVGQSIVCYLTHGTSVMGVVKTTVQINADWYMIEFLDDVLVYSHNIARIEMLKVGDE